ncbi:MAG TPA: GNAT family N-acetyltransferase [Actinocrinis sp.]|jgi:RimJ/RimL family protein N-acetyltransferase
MRESETEDGPRAAETVESHRHVGAAGAGATVARDLTGVSLSTARLVLRELGADDIDAITAACQDELIQRYTTVPSPYSRADAEKFVLEVSPAGRRAGTDAVFGVFVAGGADGAGAGPADSVLARQGGLVGTVGMHRIAHVGASYGGNGELGYWAAPWARGHGYVAEAAAAVCRWGFADLGLARIEWYALSGNESSWAVARRCGFRRDGTLRAWLVHRGARHDAWAGSLLPGELTDTTSASENR